MTAIAMDAASSFDMGDVSSLATFEFDNFFRAGAHACPAPHALFRIHPGTEGEGVIQQRPDNGENPLINPAPGLS